VFGSHTREWGVTSLSVYMQSVVHVQISVSWLIMLASLVLVGGDYILSTSSVHMLGEDLARLVEVGKMRGV
jgi:hypothetical protein